MHNTDASDMLLEIENLSNSTNVVTSSNVSEMSRFILDPFDNLSLFEIVFDGITFVDFRMRESNGSGIAGNDVWNLVGTNCFLDDFQQFEFGLSFFNLNKSESSLDIIEYSVVFVSLGKRNSIHDSDWELDGSSDFIINSDASFLILDNDVSFTSIEAKLEVMSR